MAGVLAALALAPLAVALARPQEVLSRRLERAEGVDLVVALDVSGSMSALDFEPTDRLGVAKEVIGQFLDGRANDRFALVVFAGAAVTLVPLTLDHAVAQHLLDEVRMGSLPDGTAIGLGLGTAVARLRHSEADSKVVVLVTDGSNNTGQLDPVNAAEMAAELDITVHTVLVGRNGMVPVPVPVRDPRTGRVSQQVRQMEMEINPELLAELARITGGSSFRARDSKALEEVFEAIDGLEKTEFTSTKLVRYRERFEPWAMAALVILLLGNRPRGLCGEDPMVSFGESRMLGLLVLPAVVGAAVIARHLTRVRLQRGLASPAVWDRVMGGLPATGLVRMLLWCGAAAMIILALARPQWGELPGDESVRTRDLVLALDVSASMLATDVPPSRMARSIEAAQRLLPLLEGNRVGVVVFSGEAYPLVPLTTDLDAVAAFLSGIYPGMVARPGSDIERAVAAALELLPPEGEGRVVVLVTDGENLQGNVDAAVSAIKESGVGALTVVAGTERGGPIPIEGPDGAIHHKRDQNGQPVITRAHPEVLAAIADAVDGASVELADRDVVGQLARIVDKLRTREAEANRTVQRVEQFPLFLMLAAGFLVGSFLLSPWRRLAALDGHGRSAVRRSRRSAAGSPAGLRSAAATAPDDGAAGDRGGRARTGRRAADLAAGRARRVSADGSPRGHPVARWRGRRRSRVLCRCGDARSRESRETL